MAICIWVLKSQVEGGSQKNQMIEALILEAAGEPKEGMYAVACAFRNRTELGMPLGASSLMRKDKLSFIKKQPKSVRDLAARIYTSVFINLSPDNTDGATHFESTDFPEPDWARFMVRTRQIGKHVFYKDFPNA